MTVTLHKPLTGGTLLPGLSCTVSELFLLD